MKLGPDAATAGVAGADALPDPPAIGEPPGDIAPMAPPKRSRRRRPPSPFFTEVWQGRPLYRCPVCRIAKTDRPGSTGHEAIRIHVTRHHPTDRRNTK
jgi:hypothetical protein